MWTPTALASEASSWRGEVWRVVEAQHRISTDRLADTREAQERLEQLAEEVKPQLPEPGADSPLEFDLSDISLDLDEPEVAAAAEVDALPDVKLEEEADQDDPGDPLARKLELAEEFRQIGDVEGARDLLEEVVANAEGALKSKAQALLKDLD
jgi:FimV-like protein